MTVQTLFGDISLKEARLIIECKLIQITTPDPIDFCTQEAKDYINKTKNHKKIKYFGYSL